MKDWLYPGAKVQCVDDSPDPFGRPLYVQKDRIYTIAKINPVFPSIHLEEVESYSRNGYWARRFRPLTKRNTDAQVEKLKRFLNTTPADLEAVE